MGLAAPRKRRKIGQDPNNTAWSSSTTGFGHKILSSQGWTPGTYLGATDAAHASHYSAANASHIRVLLKDDNLGLGAKSSHAEGHNFGLGTFQDLLGRLNGKSEGQLQKDQSVRADLGRKLYAEQKWGPSKFVRGGFLIGDKIEEEEIVESDIEGRQGSTVVPQERHASNVVGVEERNKNAEAKSEGKGKGKKDGKTRKLKRKSNSDVKVTDAHPGGSLQEGAVITQANQTATAEPAESKAERRKRKLEKRALKEAKLLRQESTPDSGQLSGEQTKTLAGASQDVPSAATQSTDLGIAKSQTPSPLPTVTYPGNRLAVRQRYIRQKKMSSMDPQALREILMLKS